MQRLNLLSLIIYLLLVAGLITRDGHVLALSLIFMVYLSFSILTKPQSMELKFQREMSSIRTSPDAPVMVKTSVTNNGSTLEEVKIFDDIPENLKVTNGSTTQLFFLLAGKTITWTYTIIGKRGAYNLNSINVVASDPFGLVRKTNSYQSQGKLFVVPPVLRLKNVVIRPRHTRVYSGIVPSRTGGTGIDFLAVREYREGDPTHWINWRISARYPSKLFANEFEQERVADVGIVLDGRIRTNIFAGGHSLFEYSVLAAATLADTFLVQGNRVSLLLYGKSLEWTFPGYGKNQKERILRVLAQAQPGRSQIFEDLDNIPTRLFPSHSQVVLISPLIVEDVEMLMKLRARGYHVIIVSPDPVSFEVSFLPDQPETKLAARIVRLERELMIKRLQRAGIQVVNWDTSQPFDQIAQSHLGRRPLWISSGDASL
jgi:uncharacterized protein (DUF58 family)